MFRLSISEGGEQNTLDYRLNCDICSECFDSERRRPRVLSCGHTLCTVCVIRVLREPNKKCPTCRKPSQAESIEDVSINYGMEGFSGTPVHEYLVGYPNIHPGFQRRGSVIEASPCSSLGSSYTDFQDRRQMSLSRMSSSPGSVFGSPGSYSSGYQTEMPFGNGSPYFIPGYGHQTVVEDTTPSAPTLCESDVPDEGVNDDEQQPRQGKRKSKIAGKIGRGLLSVLLS